VGQNVELVQGKLDLTVRIRAGRLLLSIGLQYGMNKQLLFRWCALVGHLGLIALLLSWFTWIAPPQNIPRVIVIALLVFPLLIPLRGILHARRYTHQWVSFLSMFYFMVGVDASFNHGEGQAWLGYLTVVLSLMLFVGCIFYARFTPSERQS